MTNVGLNRIARAVENFLDYGTYTVDGQKKTTDIHKVTAEDNKIRVFLYLNETEGVGNLTEFELIDDEGNVFEERADSISKDNLKGLLVAFDYDIQEV